jgi:hypothetical protein
MFEIANCNLIEGHLLLLARRSSAYYFNIDRVDVRRLGIGRVGKFLCVAFLNKLAGMELNGVHDRAKLEGHFGCPLCEC